MRLIALVVLRCLSMVPAYIAVSHFMGVAGQELLGFLEVSSGWFVSWFRDVTTGLVYMCLYGSVAASLWFLAPFISRAMVPSVTPGICPNCGHTTTGNASGRCPECGLVLGFEAPVRGGAPEKGVSDERSEF